MIVKFLRWLGFRPTFGKKTTPTIPRKVSIPMSERKRRAAGLQ